MDPLVPAAGNDKVRQPGWNPQQERFNDLLPAGAVEPVIDAPGGKEVQRLQHRSANSLEDSIPVSPLRPEGQFGKSGLAEKGTCDG